MDTRVKPAYDAEYVAASCSISKFKFQTAKRSRSRAAARGGLLVDLPFLRGDGTPKGAPLVFSAAAYFPDCQETEATETPSSVPPRRFLPPSDRSSARS